ncbi:hypothetical protein HDE_06752 [Halotydeus destructor]|nr:hypothetical protein HDE_06752 [Halotydeus destructor]
MNLTLLTTTMAILLAIGLPVTRQQPMAANMYEHNGSDGIEVDDDIEEDDDDYFSDDKVPQQQPGMMMSEGNPNGGQGVIEWGKEVPETNGSQIQIIQIPVVNGALGGHGGPIPVGPGIGYEVEGDDDDSGQTGESGGGDGSSGSGSGYQQPGQDGAGQGGSGQGSGPQKQKADGGGVFATVTNGPTISPHFGFAVSSAGLYVLACVVFYILCLLCCCFAFCFLCGCLRDLISKIDGQLADNSGSPDAMEAGQMHNSS